MKTKDLLLWILLLTSAATSFAQSGKVGQLTWTLSDGGTLTIDGIGVIPMPNYSNYYHAPWHSYLSFIKKIVIGNDIESIGANAFPRCSNLTSLTLSNRVTRIEEGAFEGCDRLTSFTLPDRITSIGESAFEGCRSLTFLTLPNSLRSIEESAFEGCWNLTFLTLPDRLTSIEESAFEGCGSLTSITIPNSVTSIGDYAFSGCRSLTSVINLNSTPQRIGYNVFSGVTLRNATLYVPSFSVDTYKTADEWKDFGTITTAN
ncbi:MAG: leucine-rich repeat domain-containing protein [Bacteroidales bacterium]|jgi:hypothetical protein|nr:leucine-rich repeat domain-containing protein [Bacteroidales bacterium]